MKKIYTFLFFVCCLLSITCKAQLFIDNGTNGTLSIRNASGGTLGTYDNTNTTVALFVDGDITVEGTYDNQAAETQFTGNLKLDSTIAGHTFTTTGDEVYISSTTPYANNTTQRINGDFRGANSFYNLILQKNATQLVELASNVEVANKILFNNSGRIRTDITGHTNDGSAYPYEIYLKNGATTSLSGNSTGNGATEKYFEGKLRRKATSTGTYYYPIGVAPASLDGMEAFELNFTVNPNMDFLGYIRPGTVDPITRNVLCDVGKDPGIGNQNYTQCSGAPDGISDWYKLETSMDLSHEWVATPSGSTTGYAYGITLHPGNLLDTKNSPNSYFTIDPTACGATYANQRLRVIAKDGIVGGNAQPAPTSGGYYPPWTHLGTCYIWCQFDNTDGDITLNTQTSFSSFRIHGTSLSSNTALPIELTFLKAEPINNQYIKVSWQTASEINNKQFEVMRSTDASNFTTIGSVNGNGTTSLTHDYAFDDHDVQPGIVYYYKLKQIDFDNSYSYTYTVNAHLTSSDAFSVSAVYPNPADGDAYVNVTTPTSGTLNFNLFNVVGQLMSNRQINLTKGFNKVKISDFTLAKGTYVAQFEYNGNTETKKLVKR